MFKKEKIERIYILSILMLPILFQYSSGLLTITIGDVFLFIGSISVIFLKRRKIYYTVSLLILFLYIFFHMLICNLFILDYGKSEVFTTMRYLFYIFNSVIFASLIKEKIYAKKAYIFISLISSLYLLLQFIIYKTKGYYLSGVISSLKLTDETLYVYENVINSAQVKRFMSFFGEPAHFATYVLGGLIIALFCNDRIKKENIVISLILSIAIVFSTSITGILALLVIWFSWFVIYTFEKKMDWKFIFIILILIITIYMLSNTQAIEYFTNKSVFEKQSLGRFRGYRYILDSYNDSIFKFFFGNGMKDIQEIIYLSGFPRMYHYFGISGIIVYFTVFIKLINKRDRINKFFILSVFVLSSGTEMLFSSFILPYLLIIILYKNTEDKIKNITDFKK